MTGYDVHHILRGLEDPELVVECVGSSSEKFTCISVNQFQDKEEQEERARVLCDEQAAANEHILCVWFKVLDSITFFWRKVPSQHCKRY